MLRHTIRFAAVGVVNTGVYYGSYLAMRPLFGYLPAHLVGLLVSMVVSFFLNARWTFHTRPTWRKFALWPLTNATNYLLTTVGVVVLVEWLGLDERIAPLVASVGAIPVTFLLSRRLLLGRDRQRASSPAGGVVTGTAPPAAGGGR